LKKKREKKRRKNEKSSHNTKREKTGENKATCPHDAQSTPLRSGPEVSSKKLCGKLKNLEVSTEWLNL
jgi:hypothetical protein